MNVQNLSTHMRQYGCATILVWFGLFIPPAQAHSPDIQTALDSAWRKALAASQARGQQQQANAAQEAARSWVSAPPALELSQRQSRNNPNNPSREHELGISLPLWQWGQRTAAIATSDAQHELSLAFEQAARWRLLGEVHETAAAVGRAEIQWQLAQQQAQSLRQLWDDVALRVKAGELAPADALAAQAEWLLATHQVRNTEQAFNTQRVHWRLLTGIEPLTRHTPLPETTLKTATPSAAELPNTVPATHPELMLFAATQAFHEKRLMGQKHSGSGTPELNLSMRQEKASATDHSVGVAVKLPWGGRAHRQPQQAQALAEIALTQAQEPLLRERLNAELQLAQQGLEHAKAQQDAESKRWQLLQQRKDGIEKAFRAGEMGLTELLRAQAAEAAAQLSVATGQIELNLARARLEQALGWLP